MRIDLFQMERFQSLYWNEVDFDLSESGVMPLSVNELLGSDPRAAAKLLETGLWYPLSEGSERLRERIADWYRGAAVENVSVTNGGSEANHLTLWSLLRPRDRLAFMVPNYMQGWGLGRHYANGTDVFRLRLRRNGTDGNRWALDLDELEKAVTKRTRVIMVCNPNNPTGSILSEDEMDALVAVARKRNAWLVADEIYRGAETDSDTAAPTFWGRYDKVVVTSGLSKAFGMPGLRIGWVVGPADFVKELWVRHDYTTLTPGVLSDGLGAVAMQKRNRERILARTRGIIRAQLPVLERWVERQGDRLTYVRPQAGAIAYLRFSGKLGSMALAERLRTEQSVLVVPGQVFSMGRFIRIGFGYDPKRLKRGLDRVGTVLASL
ncbi:MAG: aminotransferase class I/II-fold pyridoxal phosphate-dependent enzyme [Actinomycetota bacterium]